MFIVGLIIYLLLKYLSSMLIIKFVFVIFDVSEIFFIFMGRHEKLKPTYSGIMKSSKMIPEHVIMTKS